MSESKQDLLEKIVTLRADIERMNLEREARHSEAAHRDFVFPIASEIQSHFLDSPLAKDHSQERLRLTKNLQERWIAFQIDYDGGTHKLTLSWATEKFIVAMCDQKMVTALETSFSNDQLKIVSVVTREMFVDRCIGALGFSELEEAA